MNISHTVDIFLKIQGLVLMLNITADQFLFSRLLYFHTSFIAVKVIFFINKMKMKYRFPKKRLNCFHGINYACYVSKLLIIS